LNVHAVRFGGYLIIIHRLSCSTAALTSQLTIVRDYIASAKIYIVTQNVASAIERMTQVEHSIIPLLHMMRLQGLMC
jgi:hypothetical protein